MDVRSTAAKPVRALTAAATPRQVCPERMAISLPWRLNIRTVPISKSTKLVVGCAVSRATLLIHSSLMCIMDFAGNTTQVGLPENTVLVNTLTT
jgi:hypothetical protein